MRQTMRKFPFSAIILGGVLLSLGSLPLSHAASFDCSKASSVVEKSICDNEELSALDERLSLLYREKYELDPNAQKKEQTLWLSERNKCLDVGCIKESYNNRISQLSGNVDLPLSGSVKADEYFVKDSQDSTNPPKNEAQDLSVAAKDSSNTDLIIISLATLVGICILVVSIFIFIKRQIKRFGDKRLINRSYLESSSIHPIFDEKKYIEIHKQKFGSDILSPQTIVAVCDIYSVEINASGTWSAQIGHVNEDAYQIAKSAYDQNLMQWNIAKAQIDAQNSQIRAENRKRPVGDSQVAYLSFNLKRPTEPKINDYVRYSPGSGDCSSALSDYILVPAQPTNFFQPPSEVNPEKIVKRILDLYSKVLPGIANGRIQVPIESETSRFESMNDDQCVQSLSSEVEGGLSKDARRQLGKYNKDFRLEGWSYSMSKTFGQLPIVLVRSALKNGKTGVSAHDLMNPEVVLAVL